MMIQFIKRHKNAVIPSRANISDVGLDLTAIKIYKRLPNGVILYDTGIAITPPQGYYTEIVPRSSISKTGWTLANNIGIIDPSYTGNLYIALVRIVQDAPEIEIPFCKCQLILRKLEYAQMQEVEILKLTERGNGGFGSTG